MTVLQYDPNENKAFGFHCDGWNEREGRWTIAEWDGAKKLYDVARKLVVDEVDVRVEYDLESEVYILSIHYSVHHVYFRLLAVSIDASYISDWTRQAVMNMCRELGRMHFLANSEK